MSYVMQHSFFQCFKLALFIFQIKWGAVGAVWGGNIFILAAMAAFFIHLGEKSPKGIHIQLHDYTNSRSALWAILKLIGNSKSNTHPPSQSLTKLES